jgi:hypothetical protein
MFLKEIFGNNFNKRRLIGGLSNKSFVSFALVRIFSIFFMKVLSWNLYGLGRAGNYWLWVGLLIFIILMCAFFLK